MSISVYTSKVTIGISSSDLLPELNCGGPDGPDGPDGPGGPGPSVCIEGFEFWGGKCVPICKPGQMRNHLGECVTCCLSNASARVTITEYRDDVLCVEVHTFCTDEEDLASVTGWIYPDVDTGGNPIFPSRWVDHDGNGRIPYQWIGEDGAPVTDYNIVYNGPGIYHVRVIITDACGNTAEDTKTIVLADLPECVPVSDITALPTTINVNDRVAILGTVIPSTATNRVITTVTNTGVGQIRWEGNGFVFESGVAGDAFLDITIKDGLCGEDYVKRNHRITVNSVATCIPINNINLITTLKTVRCDYPKPAVYCISQNPPLGVNAYSSTTPPTLSNTHYSNIKTFRPNFFIHDIANEMFFSFQGTMANVEVPTGNATGGVGALGMYTPDARCRLRYASGYFFDGDNKRYNAYMKIENIQVGANGFSFIIRHDFIQTPIGYVPLIMTRGGEQIGSINITTSTVVYPWNELQAGVLQGMPSVTKCNF